LANGFEQMDRAHDIAGVGFGRVSIGGEDPGLCGEMEDDLRRVVGEGTAQPFRIPDVGENRHHLPVQASEFEQVGVRARRQRITDHSGTHGLQPHGKPAPLEAGMAGQQDTPVFPENRLDHQIFHGAIPDAQSCSR
jgi:hypothetical protein